MYVIPSSRIFEKKSAESFTISADFTDILASGDTLSSCTASAIDYEHGTNLSSGANKVIGSTTATVSSPTASIVVEGGTAGRDYKITLTGTTAVNADTLVFELLMRVR